MADLTLLVSTGLDEAMRCNAERTKDCPNSNHSIGILALYSDTKAIEFEAIPRLTLREKFRGKCPIPT